MKKYQIKSGYVLRKVAGDYLAIPVTMDPGIRRAMILLNSVGYFLWEKLEKARTVKELAELVTEEFDIRMGAAETDIEEFLLQLSKEHLLQKRNAVSNTKRPDEIDN